MNLNDIPYMILVPGNNLLRQVWNKLLSPCYKVDDGSRLDTSCSNKTTVIQAVCFYELIVTNVLTTVRRYQTCWKNLLRVCCPLQPCYKMHDNNLFQACHQLGTKQFEHISLTNCGVTTRLAGDLWQAHSTFIHIVESSVKMNYAHTNKSVSRAYTQTNYEKNYHWTMDHSSLV
jgi:hypothetical protein